MKISVALATYNGERFLPDQLASLARQTHAPAELVVQDDRSSDGTLALLDEFATSAPFPVSIASNPQRLGVADNFVAALARCTGDAVAFCDQDDVWNGHRLELCAAQFADPEVQLVMHAHEVVDDSLRPLVPRRPAYRERIRIPQGERHPGCERYAIGCTLVFRKSVADALVRCWPRDHAAEVRRLGHGILNHDGVARELARGLGAMIYLPETLVRYRRHAANVSDAGLAPPKMLARWSAASSTNAGELLRLGDDYETVTKMYEAAAAAASGVAAAGLVSLGAIWKVRAEHCRARAALYQTSSHGQRLKQWKALLRNGAYRAWAAGGMGRGAATVDFLRCFA